MLELKVKERDMKVKPEKIRAEGMLPAVFYGPKEKAHAVALNAKDFEKVWEEAGGSAIVVLKGIGDDKEALIHDVDTHPVTGTVRHADFYVIERGKKIEVTVPLEFVGEAPAEKAGHVVVKVMHEVEVKVRPSELPQHLDIDISKLEHVGDHITVGDIALPESGEFVTDSEETVVSVKEMTVEKEPEVTEAAEAGEEGPAEEGMVPAEATEEVESKKE